LKEAQHKVTQGFDFTYFFREVKLHEVLDFLDEVN